MDQRIQSQDAISSKCQQHGQNHAGKSAKISVIRVIRVLKTASHSKAT
jgi:hypothetical protein